MCEKKRLRRERGSESGAAEGGEGENRKRRKNEKHTIKCIQRVFRK